MSTTQSYSPSDCWGATVVVRVLLHTNALDYTEGMSQNIPLSICQDRWKSVKLCFGSASELQYIEKSLSRFKFKFTVVSTNIHDIHTGKQVVLYGLQHKIELLMTNGCKIHTEKQHGLMDKREHS